MTDLRGTYQLTVLHDYFCGGRACAVIQSGLAIKKDLDAERLQSCRKSMPYLLDFLFLAWMSQPQA